MPIKFNEIKFSECLSNIVDNRGKTCPTSPAGIPLIATNCIKNDSLYPVFENVRYVSEEIYDDWFRAHPKPGDLIFVTKGSPGRVCWVPNPVSFCIAQDMLAIRAKEEVINPKFLFALLRSSEVQQSIENLHVGSLIPHFKKGDFDQLMLNIPDDINVQERIGNIYFDFCNKIELNRRTNHTLEQIARTLFKKYFVDDIDLENLPDGWSLRSIYDLAIFINGAAFKNSDFSKTKEALPIIKIVELKYGITSTTMFSNKNLEEKYKIENGDILFSWSGSPETSIDTFLWINNTAWLNQHIFKVVTESREMRTYVYYLLNYFKPIFIDIAKNKQTTGLGHVTINDLKRLKVAFPDSSTLSRFASEVSPILDCIQNNLLENRNIIAIRDSLLPKLMSGDIEVNVAEKELANQ